MRSDYSSSVRCLAGCNYGSNSGRLVKLNYGSSSSRTDYLQTWLQGADARADARAALQFKKQVSGCRNNRSEPPSLIGGCSAQPQAPAT